MTGKTIQLIVKCTEVLKLIITGVHNTHTHKKNSIQNFRQFSSLLKK